MPNKGDIFEEYVQFVYQTLLGAQGRNISVSRRAMVTDTRGNTYNIDVFYEFDIAGVHHRVAIECKDTKRPVERDDTIAFIGKIRDLPSTIGVFISNGGFQPAAKKYLEDHGVLHYDGDELPHFNAVLGEMISPMVLPSESAIGQPFWSLMEMKDGAGTGVWLGVPDPDDQSRAFPLFYSKPLATLYMQLAYPESDSVCVRGIEQSTLRFLIMWAHDDGSRFFILEPHDESPGLFAGRGWTARDLASWYCTDDLSSALEAR
ncbi:restriction endonuclease [Lentzea sp. HUAS12]|uniref:restriction endonuclease n=1 Tax=Lentzea sp. HUAS12 TaxID=2951806 RepID=UPI00209FE053|nr:restriction endonuclease [Lentzea sp. HUAS12]USX56333.1 restriction endonuclease [Lentzea sp. HUAS12]